MNHRPFTIVALLVACVASVSQSEEARKFDASQYPVDSFQISTQTIVRGSVQIDLTQVKPRIPSEELSWTPEADEAELRRREEFIRTHPGPSFDCLGWVHVKRKGRTIFNRFWEIHSVGGSYGLTVAAKSPSHDVIILKDGDYESQSLLISDAGKIIEVNGYVDMLDDQHLVFYRRESEGKGFAILNTTDGKIVAASLEDKKTGNIPAPYTWYKDATGYFFTKAEDDENDALEVKEVIYRLDLTSGYITSTSASTSTFVNASRVVDENVAANNAQCQ